MNKKLLNPIKLYLRDDCLLVKYVMKAEGYVILILTSCVSGPISLMQPMTPVIHSQHLMGLAGPGEDHSFLAGLLLKYFTSKYSKGTCTTFGTPSKCFPNISVHNII
ncbi:unnamed protein product [Arctia plantaginis]|uniref:Uncharacterized protein n=1 Tax=Arctia plantaginis TaxID=874455 RepID=A0A8S1BAF2_ARCPL|nr:unnamed protein product [Arctia plantaginis]